MCGFTPGFESSCSLVHPIDKDLIVKTYSLFF
jgi:hypothetical protein